MFGLSNDQLTSLLRQVIQAVGAVLTTLGIVTIQTWGGWESTIFVVAGPLISIAAAIWAAFARKQTQMVATVAAMPEVRTIAVTTPELAASAGREVVQVAPGSAGTMPPAAQVTRGNAA